MGFACRRRSLRINDRCRGHRQKLPCASREWKANRKATHQVVVKACGVFNSSKGVEYRAMENRPLKSKDVFPLLWEWWFSIAMLVYRRVKTHIYRYIQRATLNLTIPWHHSSLVMSLVLVLFGSMLFFPLIAYDYDLSNEMISSILFPAPSGTRYQPIPNTLGLRSDLAHFKAWLWTNGCRTRVKDALHSTELVESHTTFSRLRVSTLKNWKTSRHDKILS